MTNHKKHLICSWFLLPGLLLLPLGSSLAAAKPTSFEQYKSECLRHTNTRGLSTTDGEKLCNCTITKFRSTYDANQFKVILQKAKTDKKLQANFKSVGESCYDEILYDS